MAQGIARATVVLDSLIILPEKIMAGKNLIGFDMS